VVTTSERLRQLREQAYEKATVANPKRKPKKKKSKR
jgi:hypothetical protein